VTQAFASHFGDNADEIPGRRSARTPARSLTPWASLTPNWAWVHRPGHLPGREKDGHLETWHQPLAEVPAPYAAHLRTSTEALLAAALAWLVP